MNDANRGMITEQVAHHEDTASAARHVHHILAFLGSQRERLFNKTVLSGAHRLDRDLSMVASGSRDRERANPRVVQDLFKTFVDASPRMTFADVFRRA